MRNKSISFRFSIFLTVIFTLIMAVFAVIATSITITRTSDQLNAKLENYLRISTVGLEAPLWNFDHGIIEGYLDSLMLDQSIVYVGVKANDGTIINRIHPTVDGLSFERLSSLDDYTTTFSDVLKDGDKIGRIEMAVSRATLREQIQTNVTAIFVLTLFLLATIAVTSILISRRYISRPLSILQQSASAIGSGNLQAEIDIGGDDEIGSLARAFDSMRNSIRHLVGELKQSNEKLENANQTLEERVDQRTKEVMVTQQKLICLADTVELSCLL
jgi:HAMP domain-containing protein